MNLPLIAGKHRFDVLDGLRGYAALVVIVYHCLLSLDPQIWHKFDRTSILEVANANEFFSKIFLVLFNGDAAVVIFFILSGFVLAQTLLIDLSRYTVSSAMIAFLARRFLRLYPAFFAALIGTVFLLMGLFHTFSIPMESFYFNGLNFVRNALLISPEISGITWSILIEFAAIPYIMFFVFLIYRFGSWPAIAFIAISLLARNFGGITFYYLKFNQYLLCFALGVFMATPLGLGIARLSASLNKTMIFVVFVGISLFVSNSAIQIVFGALMVGAVMFSKGASHRFLSHPISMYFGKISYGLYLWHYPFAVMLYTPFAIYAPWALGDYAIWYGLSAAPLIALIAIGLGHLSERFLERPYIDLGQRVSVAVRQPRPGAVTARSRKAS